MIKSFRAPAWALATSCALALALAGAARAETASYGQHTAEVHVCVDPISQQLVACGGGAALFPTASMTTLSGAKTYSAGQLIANSTTAGNVVPLTFLNACRVPGGTEAARRVRYYTTDTGFAGKQVALKLYTDSPTVQAGDGGAYLSNRSGFKGTYSLTLSDHFTDAEGGAAVADVGDITYACAAGSTTMYGLVVANDSGSITAVGGATHTAIIEAWPVGN